MAKQTFTTGDVLTAAAMTSLQQTAMGGGSTTAKTASYTLVAADAGTVVQMNSASATTITVNTALFAAGDTVQIQNIGAGVCTVTAGTATVNTAGSLALSQWEGGQLYFTATGASIFFDVIQSSSASGLTLIATAPFTASAGLSVNSCFTSTYKNYKVVFRIKASTASGTIAWRWRTSGTDLTTASYYYGWNFTNNGATTTLAGANAATSIDLGGVTATAYYDNYSFDVFGPQSNTQVPSFYGGATFTNAGQRGFGGGISTTVGTYDGFSLVTTQNITGEYMVYGYAN